MVIENYPEGQIEELEAVNNPEDPAAGTRKVPFSRVLYIEQRRLPEDPPKKFFRLAPGSEVRLRYAYFINCDGRGEGSTAGEIVECAAPTILRRAAAMPPDGRKVKATHPLGVGGARGRRRGAAVRPSVHDEPIPTTAGEGRTSPRT